LELVEGVLVDQPALVQLYPAVLDDEHHIVQAVAGQVAGLFDGKPLRGRVPNNWSDYSLGYLLERRQSRCLRSYRARWAGKDSNLRRLSQRIYSPPPLPLGTPTLEHFACVHYTTKRHSRNSLTHSSGYSACVSPVARRPCTRNPHSPPTLQPVSARKPM
jgi:hypothetical protein